MNDERVIDGVLHRREGKTYVPMSAQELTCRLLEARQAIPRILGPLPAAPAPFVFPVYPPPLSVPDWRPPYEITCTTGSQH